MSVARRAARLCPSGPAPPERNDAWGSGAAANMRSMTSDGSSYARFRRALAAGNIALVKAAAAELPRVDLDDALEVCVLMARDDHPAFERAAVRWVARLCLERRVGIHDTRCALALFETMPADPAGAARSLRRLAKGWTRRR